MENIFFQSAGRAAHGNDPGGMDESIRLSPVSGDLFLAWRQTEGGARLLRVYGTEPIADLPDEIGGVPVTEIGPYCFAEKAAPEAAALAPPEHLRAVNGNFVEEISLPSGVATLHNAAFYNCRKLRVLRVGGAIRSIGSDEFTNCRSLKTLVLRCRDGEETGLPVLLSRLESDLSVQFCPEGAPEAALFFPEYYEWLDEISPAHIFSRSIHGEGFRMRKSFAGFRLDYGKYDRCFPAAKKVEEPLTLCRIALDRLRFPRDLGAEARALYEETLAGLLPAALSYGIGQRSLPVLTFLCERFSPEADAMQDAIRQCIDAGWGEGSAALLALQPKRGSFAEKEFIF